MAPEYREVYIPLEKTAEYERLVAEMGGNYKGKKATREEVKDEIQAAWLCQRTQVLPFIEAFKHPKDLESLRIRNQGIIRLAASLWDDSRLKFHGQKPVDSIDWNMVSEALRTIFERCLPENAPMGFDHRKHEKSLAQYSRRHYTNIVRNANILPQSLGLLVKFYGLDGVVRTPQELGQEYGLTDHQIYGVISYTKKQLAHDEELAPLLVEDQD